MKGFILGLCCGGAFTVVGVYLLVVWLFKDVHR